MNSTHPWPMKGQKAFMEGPPDQSFYPKESAFSRRADEFRQTARMLLVECRGENCYRGHDYLFFPIAYLYRHSIELYLKEIIQSGVGLNLADREKADSLTNEHSLARLWNLAKTVLIGRWGGNGNDEPVYAVEAVLNELHQADPNGQHFRYESSLDGNTYEHIKLPQRICPNNMLATMEAVCTFLSATSGGLTDDLSNR